MSAEDHPKGQSFFWTGADVIVIILHTVKKIIYLS